MQRQPERGTITVRDGWVTCPDCGRNHRLLYVSPETVAKNLQVYCRVCKREIILDIEMGQSVKRQSQ